MMRAQAYLACGVAVIALASGIDAHANSADGGGFVAVGSEQNGAQSDTSEATGVSDIIVTAQKREQSLNEVPISITAVTGDALTMRGISSPSDLARIVPGLTAQPSPYNVPVYTLRGVGFYESSLSAAPTVAVYTDEVPLPFSVMTRGATLDLQRVEVLKGPQGTLFGNNTTGGAINYIANKPTDVFSAGLDVSYGRFNTVDAQGFISGPVADGVKARLAVRTVQSNGWQKSLTRPGDTLGAQNQWQGRLLVDWDITDRLKVAINLNGWRDRSDTLAWQLSGFQIAVPGSPREAALYEQVLAPKNARYADWTASNIYGKPFKHDDYFMQSAVRADYELNDDLTLTSISALQRFKVDSYNDFDGTPLRGADLRSRGHINSFAQELRIAGGTGPVSFVLGGNYQNDRTLDQLVYNFAASTTGSIGPYEIGLTGNYTRQDVKSIAAFANVEWEVVDNLTLQAGARYSDSKRKFEGCSLDILDPAITHEAFNFLQTILRTDGGYDPIGPKECWTFRENFSSYGQDRVRARLNEDNVSWRLSASYKTGAQGLIYATVSKGYKSGSFPTGAMTNDVQYSPVKQESLLAYEVGLKQPVFGNKVQVTAAAFYYNYKGKQLRSKLDTILGPLDALTSVPKSRLWGFEGQIVAQPFRGYNLTVGGTYIDTKIQEFMGYNSGGVYGDYAGSRFPYAPKVIITADNQYTFALGGDLEAFVGGSLTYNSTTNASFGDPVDYRIPAYTLIDARLGVNSADGRWSAQIWGRNITDKYYITNAVLFNDNKLRFAGMPATYGVSVKLRY